MELLTSRPSGMAFPTFRRKLAEQNRWLKRRKKGITIWNSNGIADFDDKGNFSRWLKAPEGTAYSHQLRERTKQMLKS